MPNPTLPTARNPRQATELAEPSPPTYLRGCRTLTLEIRDTARISRNLALSNLLGPSPPRMRARRKIPDPPVRYTRSRRGLQGWKGQARKIQSFVSIST